MLGSVKSTTKLEGEGRRDWKRYSPKVGIAEGVGESRGPWLSAAVESWLTGHWGDMWSSHWLNTHALDSAAKVQIWTRTFASHRPWTSTLTSLYLSFLICKTKMMTITLPWVMRKMKWTHVKDLEEYMHTGEEARTPGPSSGLTGLRVPGNWDFTFAGHPKFWSELGPSLGDQGQPCGLGPAFTRTPQSDLEAALQMWLNVLP